MYAPSTILPLLLLLSGHPVVTVAVFGGIVAQGSVWQVDVQTEPVTKRVSVRGQRTGSAQGTNNVVCGGGSMSGQGSEGGGRGTQASVGHVGGWIVLE